MHTDLCIYLIRIQTCDLQLTAPPRQYSRDCACINQPYVAKVLWKGKSNQKNCLFSGILIITCSPVGRKQVMTGKQCSWNPVQKKLKGFCFCLPCFVYTLHSTCTRSPWLTTYNVHVPNLLTLGATGYVSMNC